MLTAAEQSRLESDLPQSYDVTWEGTTYTYSFDAWWTDEEHSRSYPEAILGWHQRGVERTEAQSIDTVASIDERPGEPKYDYGHERRLYDELSVRCLVKDAVNSDGVPAKHRAEAFATTLRNHFEHRFDQNSAGSSGERPVVARPSREPVHDVIQDPNGTAVQEYVFRVELRYTEHDTETVETVADVSYDVETRTK